MAQGHDTKPGSQDIPTGSPSASRSHTDASTPTDLHSQKLPDDPRESKRGRLRSALLVVASVALIAAFTWFILTWREGQAKQEIVEAKQEEIAEERVEEGRKSSENGAPNGSQTENAPSVGSEGTMSETQQTPAASEAA